MGILNIFSTVGKDDFGVNQDWGDCTHIGVKAGLSDVMEKEKKQLEQSYLLLPTHLSAE